MLLKALGNNQLPTWPLTEAAVQKHLPDRSPATHKGSMKRQCKGLRTTRGNKRAELAANLEEIEMVGDINSP